MQDWKTTQLIQYSWRIISQDRVFWLFPILSGISMAAVFVATVGSLVAMGFFERLSVNIEGISFQKLIDSSVSGASVIDIVVVISGYLLFIFAGMYFSAMMLAAASQRLGG